MTDLEMKAIERIEKARVRLQFERKFYGVLVSNVEPVLTKNFPTAATNGKQHFWNADFVMGLKKNHRGIEVPPANLVFGVLVHES
jgi:hypothetical protein